MTAMTLTTNTRNNSMGVVNVASGKWVSDAGTAAAQTFALGFVPRYFEWVNATDRITDQWYEGMANDSAVETAANGVRTLETSGGISLGTAALGTAATVSVHADLIPASKTGYWLAIG